MLFGKIKQIISNHNKRYVRNNCLISPRLIPRRYGWFNMVLFTVNKSERLIAMSRSLKFRHYFSDLSVSRLWTVWTRSYTLNSVVKRCRKDRGVREVLQSVKQTLFRSKRTLLLSVTAAYKNDDDCDDDEDEDDDFPCYKDITDEELEVLVQVSARLKVIKFQMKKNTQRQRGDKGKRHVVNELAYCVCKTTTIKALTTELESVDELSRLTLYCTTCGRRLAIDKRHAGVCYCSCKVSIAENDSHDGWVPYMEADDVIIWRKEYKSGHAYKVYGRYPEVMASDFAAVQVDGRYRKAWDAAVAALSTVEANANGVQDQTVLHWEVMWPRLFSNRDYVYIRRHKHFNTQQKHLEHKDNLFKQVDEKIAQKVNERPSVHSNAKRKAMIKTHSTNKVYVIISKSCVHDDVPESKNAVRVKDYWSQMVVKSLHGTDKSGMEFVLTYYDDAGGGGLGGVTAWATGRAAAAYLARMRQAARDYTSYTHLDSEMETSLSKETTKDQSTQTDTLPHEKKQDAILPANLPDIDSDCDIDVAATETLTDDRKEVEVTKANDSKEEVHKENDVTEPMPKVEENEKQMPSKQEVDDCVEEDEKNSTWWRYLYPFYYFL